VATAELGEVVTDELTAQLTANFNTRFDAVAPHRGCAVCGARCLPAEIGTISLTDGRLLRLEATVELVDKRTALPVEYRSVYPVVPVPGSSHRPLRLYPEHVSSSGAVQVCHRCSECLTADRVPTFSLAAGCELGAAPATLVPLTLAEQYLVAPQRLYVSTLKLSMGKTRAANGWQQLNGHTIVFPHDGPRSTSAVGALANGPLHLPRLELPPDSLSVTFVGTAPDWDALKRRHGVALRNKLREFFDVRPEVVLQWLRFFKATHPAYADIVVHDSEAVRERLLKLPDHLMSQVHIVSEPSALDVQAALGGDVAHARDPGMMDPDQWQPPSGDGGGGDMEGTAPGGAGHGAPGAHGGPDAMEVDSEGAPGAPAQSRGLVFTWDTSLVCPDPVAVTDADDVRLIAALHGMLCPTKAAATDADRGPPIIGVTRDAQPVNEFTSNRDLIAGVFPWLFPVGWCSTKEGTLPPQLVRHLLLHASTRWAQDARFVLLAFNQKMRHEACRSAGVRVASDSAAKLAFKGEVERPDFQDRMEAAVANPKSDDAKVLVKTLAPLVQLTAASVSFSAQSRAAVLSKQYAFCQLFGLPAVFITIAPAEMCSTFVLRLCKPPADPNHSDAEVLREFRLPALDDRARAAYENPVACAEFFARLVDAVVTQLLGVELDQDVRRTRLPTRDRKCGALGRPLAYMHVVECQERGALRPGGVGSTAQPAPALASALHHDS
jgi:hypothetical protein